MDVLNSFIAGLVVAGIIWGVATVLDRKQKRKRETALVTNDDLYGDE
jgi:hypothetical protein